MPQTAEVGNLGHDMVPIWLSNVKSRVYRTSSNILKNGKRVLTHWDTAVWSLSTMLGSRITFFTVNCEPRQLMLSSQIYEYHPWPSAASVPWQQLHLLHYCDPSLQNGDTQTKNSHTSVDCWHGDSQSTWKKRKKVETFLSQSGFCSKNFRIGNPSPLCFTQQRLWFSGLVGALLDDSAFSPVHASYSCYTPSTNRGMGKQH